MKKNAFYFLLCLMIYGCFPEVETIYVVNNSSQKILALHALASDTLLPKDTIINPETKRIWLKEYDAVPINPLSTEPIEQEFIINGISKTFVFILSPDTIAKYTWDVVRENNNILARYCITPKYLKENKWKVQYPPAPWMKELEMYPSYDEIISKTYGE
ncbi:MAG: hypothetical protein IJL45_06410 [Prevotella sp.]|nr:hypothetical protein [Prevotella sp.]